MYHPKIYAPITLTISRDQSDKTSAGGYNQSSIKKTIHIGMYVCMYVYNQELSRNKRTTGLGPGPKRRHSDPLNSHGKSNASNCTFHIVKITIKYLSERVRGKIETAVPREEIVMIRHNTGASLYMDLGTRLCCLSS